MQSLLPFLVSPTPCLLSPFSTGPAKCFSAAQAKEGFLRTRQDVNTMTLTDPSKLLVSEDTSASGEGGLLLFLGSETSTAPIHSRDLKIQKALPFPALLPYLAVGRCYEKKEPVQYHIDILSVKAVCCLPPHALITTFSYGEEHRCQAANL